MSSRSKPSTEKDRRGDGRAPLERRVTLRFLSESVSGPGQNVSTDGVLFVADGEIEVVVTIDGEKHERRGQLVRAHPLGEGRLGLAIKFTAP